MKETLEPTIEMPKKYIEHVEDKKKMTADELSDINVITNKQNNIEALAPRLEGERRDFIDEMVEAEIPTPQSEVVSNELPADKIENNDIVIKTIDNTDESDMSEILKLHSANEVADYIEKKYNTEVKPGFIYSADKAYSAGTMSIGKVYEYLMKLAGLSENSENASRLAMQLYRETETMVNEYTRTKNTSLKGKILENLEKTTEKLKQVKDKDMNIYFQFIEKWEKLMNEKL